MLDGFTEVKETKKILDKIKKVCTYMAKFNLNSPCLLQFMKVNGEYEVILSYNPHNGDNFNFYNIFNVITFDNFVISDDDSKFFIKEDERVSIPVIVSTYPIAENNNDTRINPIPFYATRSYCYSIDSYYVFPKFILEAIKAEEIAGFETMQLSYDNNIHTMNFNINLKNTDRFRYILFIHNQEKLENIFKLSVFPFHTPSQIKDLYMKLYLDSANSKIVLDPKQWQIDFEKYRECNAFKVKGFNDQSFTIYHNDFFQPKIVYGHGAKFYESRDDGTGNIASLYFVICLMGGIYEYFKYRYYDI